VELLLPRSGPIRPAILLVTTFPSSFTHSSTCFRRFISLFLYILLKCSVQLNLYS
jgi:hypothetical protein